MGFWPPGGKVKNLDSHAFQVKSIIAEGWGTVKIDCLYRLLFRYYLTDAFQSV